MSINLKFTFTPKRLLKIESEIKEVHLNSNKNFDSKKIDTNQLRTILDKIESLSKDQIPRFSYELTKNELYLLADYMPRNSYNVDLNKLYEILKIRFRDEFLPILFNGFQNHYYNSDFNEYFRKLLKLSSSPHEALNISSEALAIFLKWLEEEDIVVKIVKSYFALDRDFYSYMKFFGFSPNRKLYEDCIKYLYTCCDKKLYLKADVLELVDIIETYNQNEMINFMNNYLLKLEIDEFQDKILEFLYSRYGNVDEMRIEYIWDKIFERAKKKYDIWVAKKQMDKFFQGDERYTFWFDYIVDSSSKILSINQKQLFLDFGEFVVVEFRDIGNAAYIYSKGIFDMYFSRYLTKSVIYDNSFFKNKDIMLTESKIIHNDGWQYRTYRIINMLIAHFK